MSPSADPRQALPTDSPIVSIGADVDVRAIVDEIKEEVRRKSEAGVYPPDLMIELIASSDQLLGAVEMVRATAHVEFRPPLRSNRPVLGTALSAFKYSITRLLRFQSMHMAGEINTFAGNVARAAGLMVDRLHDLEERQSAAAARVDRLERRLRQISAAGATPSSAAPDPAADGAANARVRSAQAEMAIDYVRFEDQFRGSTASVRQRQAPYVELFRGQARQVLDVGCGRGEFLDLLRQAGVASYGIDQSPGMAERCRESGLDVIVADALDHLDGLEPEALGGVFSAQVVEHFDPTQLVLFFELAIRALAPGGVFVAETLNPQSLSTYTGPLYVDLGHSRPLHPLTLQFIAQNVGFQTVEVRFLSPIPAQHRLTMVPGGSDTGNTANADLVRAVNENFRRIDEAMFGPLDFALVAKK